jgi:signal peptidase I
LLSWSEWDHRSWDIHQQVTAMKMARRERAGAKSDQRSAPGAVASAGGKPRKATTGRESIESFVVVFLSFLIWSLEAEGFVIPTGSMATTLMGRHKEITCPQCGYVYRVNADREVEPAGSSTGAGRRIDSGTCENCRFESKVGDEPSFGGDRIYVMKNGVSLPFFANRGRVELKRFDVAVFKLPEEPEVRYIKRLVGMPNEAIRIERGDLWVRPLDRPADFERLRRPLEHQQAMQMIVYDDAHRALALAGDSRWLRWAAARPGDWTEPAPGQFAARDRAGDWNELVYHHVVPSPAQWEAIRTGRPLPTEPRATLITDYNSYNTDLSADDHHNPQRAARAWFQPHCVGDLTLSLRLTVPRMAGQVRLELIKAGLSSRCEIELATGRLQLFHETKALGTTARPELTRPGTHELTFANVDDRLTLWIDGVLPFGDGPTYDSPPQKVSPTAADLEPVRIAARAAAVEVDGLVLKRDVYYTLEPARTDYANLGTPAHSDSSTLLDLLSDPARFGELAHNPPREYPIGPGRYLMLGDNSPWSRDARAWGRTDQADPDLPGSGWDNSGRASWEVPEILLVGKAFCVYWPHPKPVWPRIRIGADLQLPILPYIERIRWIR